MRMGVIRGTYILYKYKYKCVCIYVYDMIVYVCNMM